MPRGYDATKRPLPKARRKRSTSRSAAQRATSAPSSACRGRAAPRRSACGRPPRGRSGRAGARDPRRGAAGTRAGRGARRRPGAPAAPAPRGPAGPCGGSGRPGAMSATSRRREPGQAGVEDEVARVLVVVVVVDRHPDVVQHARRPQQLALAGIAVVQPLRRRAGRTAPRARAATWFVCARSTRYCRARFSTRVAADVVEQVVRPGEQRLEEDALAQACLRDLDALEAADLEHRLHDGGAAEDDVGARGLDARHAPALGGGHARQAVDELAERLARDDEALDADVRLAGEVLGGGRQVADRAADADEPVARVGQPRRAAELLRHVGAQRLELLARHGAAVGEEALRRAHGAQRPGRQLVGPALARRARAAASRRRGRGRRRRRSSSSSPRRGARRAPPARSTARGPAAPVCSRARSANALPLRASRIALVATGRTSVMSSARQKCANTSIVCRARCIGSSPSSPVSPRPAPMRTAS